MLFFEFLSSFFFDWLLRLSFFSQIILSDCCLLVRVSSALVLKRKKTYQLENTLIISHLKLYRISTWVAELWMKKSANNGFKIGSSSRWICYRKHFFTRFKRFLDEFRININTAQCMGIKIFSLNKTWTESTAKLKLKSIWNARPLKMSYQSV